MMYVWVGAGVAAACILSGVIYKALRKRRRERRRSERRKRNLGRQLAWNLFMVPKRALRIEYRRGED